MEGGDWGVEADDQSKDLLLGEDLLVLACATIVQAHEPSTAAGVEQRGPGTTTRPDSVCFVKLALPEGGGGGGGSAFSFDTVNTMWHGSSAGGC